MFKRVEPEPTPKEEPKAIPPKPPENKVLKFGVYEREIGSEFTNGSCRWCNNAEPGVYTWHPGICHRVKNIEHYENGMVKSVEFWPKGEQVFSPDNKLISEKFDK